MEVHVFLLQLAMVLMAARFFGEIAAHWGMPPVIGELAAGIILGPSLLGLLQPSEMLHLLAEIGIILLLFEVGLDSDVNRLIHAGAKSLTVAIGGFVVPFALGFGVSHYTFGLPVLTSMVLGGTLTATSIGITVRVLTDLGRRHSIEGQVILGAAVLDDVLGVILLALLYEFAVAGEVALTNALRIALFVSVFFMIAPAAAKVISYLIHRFEASSGVPGLIPTAMVALVLVFSGMAHFMGAPELLGGFAAGLALSRRFFLPFGVALAADPGFADLIRDQMKPIVRLFTPIFFVSIGLSLNLQLVNWGSPFIWTFSLVMLIVAVVGKFAGAMMIDEPGPRRIVIGMGMVPRGEVGLVFTELGRDSGLLTGGIYDVLILVIAYTTLVAPFWIKWYYRRHAGELEPAIPEEDMGYPAAPAVPGTGPPPVTQHTHGAAPIAATDKAVAFDPDESLSRG
ncbi:MAG: cation:proton antiporter [Gammaproteobacteria bacterium]